MAFGTPDDALVWRLQEQKPVDLLIVDQLTPGRLLGRDMAELIGKGNLARLPVILHEKLRQPLMIVMTVRGQRNRRRFARLLSEDQIFATDQNLEFQDIVKVELSPTPGFYEIKQAQVSKIISVHFLVELQKGGLIPLCHYPSLGGNSPIKCAKFMRTVYLSL